MWQPTPALDTNDDGTSTALAPRGMATRRRDAVRAGDDARATRFAREGRGGDCGPVVTRRRHVFFVRDAGGAIRPGDARDDARAGAIGARDDARARGARAGDGGDESLAASGDAVVVLRAR